MAHCTPSWHPQRCTLYKRGLKLGDTSVWLRAMVCVFVGTTASACRSQVCYLRLILMIDNTQWSRNPPCTDVHVFMTVPPDSHGLYTLRTVGVDASNARTDALTVPAYQHTCVCGGFTRTSSQEQPLELFFRSVDPSPVTANRDGGSSELGSAVKRRTVVSIDPEQARAIARQATLMSILPLISARQCMFPRGKLT